MTRTIQIVLCRHGETDWTRDRRWCGWSDPALNRTGMAQARALGSRWQELLGDAIPDSFVSSDLRRAVETARIASDAADVSGRWPELRVDRRFRELDFGRIEGRTWAELDEPTQSALLTPTSFEAPGGESVRTLVERVVAALESLAGSLHVVVTHGGPARELARLAEFDIELEPGTAVMIDLDRDVIGVARDREPTD